MRSFFLFINFCLLLMVPSFILKAQIKPDATIVVPNPTGNISMPYKPADHGIGSQVNYVRTFQIQQPISDETSITSTVPTVHQVNVSTQYLDGLGKPLQTVDWQASPGKQDIVTPFVFDELGNEQYKFLPYTSPSASGTAKSGEFKQNPFTEQGTFYTATYIAEQPAFVNESFFIVKPILNCPH